MFSDMSVYQSVCSWGSPCNHGSVQTCSFGTPQPQGPPPHTNRQAGGLPLTERLYCCANASHLNIKNSMGGKSIKLLTVIQQLFQNLI